MGDKECFMSLFPVRRSAEGHPSASPESVRSELDKLLSSRGFAASERHRRFLQFVVEESLAGRQDGVKESVLAVEVFGRTGSFDPRTDSVVRSEARNLRARLNEYYSGEGSGDPVVIEIPKGSYVPVFRTLRAGRFPFTRFALAGALALALCGFAWWFFAVRPALSGAGLRSIAVLPFLNLTGGADGDYAADGFVEDLTTRFGQVRELRVAARTSAFQFRGKNQDIRKIGRDLGVAAVLEGGFREEKGRVKVTAQLIDARQGYHLWAEGYERQAGDLQKVEDEILLAVSNVLGVRPIARTAPLHTPPPEAREAYWQGRYLKANNWQHAGAESVPYFERAVAADPQFAEAWASLASVHANMAFHLEGRVADEVAKSREAARRALALNDTIPETYQARALLSYSHDFDWPAAERDYRRALDLNPSYAAGHRSFALELMALGRFDEAIEHLKTAEQLDPISILTTNNMATTLYCARRYDEAVRVARRHVEMDPQFFPAQSVMALCDAETGRYAEAIDAFEKARARAGESADLILGPLGNALGRAGRLNEARSILTELESAQKSDGTAAVALAMVHVGLGERKQAIECLRQAADTHVTDVLFIGVNPLFDSLRGDADFQALCTRLGLPARAAGH
jgi:serine/threonine-protein kinase